MAHSFDYSSGLAAAAAFFGSQSALARAVNRPRSAVTMWKTRGTPEKMCWTIHALTKGAVTRAALRPDLFGGAQ